MKNLKLIFLSIFAVACTQKYQTYHVIDKYNYKIDNYEAPISPKLLRAQRVSKEICTDQVFFAQNAEKNAKRLIETAVANMCGEKRFIMDAKLTENWWTVIAYSRSCMVLEGYCTR
ncbi:MAG: hypothetical protein VYA54_04425 [Bdellovibrionota bacterium]|nr:hypothetical protein [Bdellovibrionota bacterium]